MSETRQGYAVAGASYTVESAPETPFWRVIAKWTVVIAVLAGGLVGLSAVLAKPPARYACPPNCGKPPTGKPVEANPRFTAPDGAFSVSYPASGSAYTVIEKPNGVAAKYITGDTGMLHLVSEPAAGRTPEQIAAGLVKKSFPNSRRAYQIPNAMVGYQPGYGAAIDYWPQDPNANYAHTRILVLVAVKNDLALVAAAVGPYHEFGPDYGPGPPSGANLEIAEDMGKYVNSFSWRGDQAR